MEVQVNLTFTETDYKEDDNTAIKECWKIPCFQESTSHIALHGLVFNGLVMVIHEKNAPISLRGNVFHQYLRQIKE